MNAEREKILSSVRQALSSLPQRAAMPYYDPAIAVLHATVTGRDLAGLLAERMQRVNGRLFLAPEALTAHLRDLDRLRGYCDPGLWPRLASYFGPEFTVEQEFDRARIDEYEFGITRAAGAIAESGTIILNDASTSRRLAALAPWVHVAVVERATIHRTVPGAIAALGDDPNIIWCTGPSKTADVEGILIEGVHGPGVQLALVV